MASSQLSKAGGGEWRPKHCSFGETIFQIFEWNRGADTTLPISLWDTRLEQVSGKRDNERAGGGGRQREGGKGLKGEREREREREREGERERERQTDRQTDRQTETQRHGETETERNRDRDIQRGREGGRRGREGEREGDREGGGGVVVWGGARARGSRILSHKEAGEDRGVLPVTDPLAVSLQPHALSPGQVGHSLARPGVLLHVAVDTTQQRAPAGGRPQVHVGRHVLSSVAAAGGGGEEVGTGDGGGEVAGGGAVGVAVIADDVVEDEVGSTVDRAVRPGEEADLLPGCWGHICHVHGASGLLCCGWRDLLDGWGSGEGVGGGGGGGGGA